MKMLRLAFFSLMSVTLASTSYAWSARGHAQIADAAFSQLTDKERRFLLPIYSVGPWISARGSPVGGAAIWPDHIRDLTLDDLFKRYGSGRVPDSLQSYHLQDTHRWHFASAYVLTPGNQVVAYEGTHCAQPVGSGQLYFVWTPLLQAFAGSTDLRDRAVILALLTHLVADAYQPLHTLAKVDQACNDDRGGNLFCVVHSKGKSCKSNLHQLWDEGFGVFDGEWWVPLRFQGDSHSLKAGAAWQSSASVIYPTEPEAASSPEYQINAKRLVRQQANLAAAHLRFLLSELSEQGEPGGLSGH